MASSRMTKERAALLILLAVALGLMVVVLWFIPRVMTPIPVSVNQAQAKTPVFAGSPGVKMIGGDPNSTLSRTWFISGKHGPDIQGHLEQILKKEQIIASTSFVHEGMIYVIVTTFRLK